MQYSTYSKVTWFNSLTLLLKWIFLNKTRKSTITFLSNNIYCILGMSNNLRSTHRINTLENNNCQTESLENTIFGKIIVHVRRFRIYGWFLKEHITTEKNKMVWGDCLELDMFSFMYIRCFPIYNIIIWCSFLIGESGQVSELFIIFFDVRLSFCSVFHLTFL